MADKNETPVTESDLQKALSVLHALSNRTPKARKDELLQKAMSGELADAEKQELFGLMNGSVAAAPITETIAKSLQNGSAEGKRVVELSPFLRDFQNGMEEGLTALASELQKGFSGQNEFNLILAKSLTAMGGVIQKMGERLQVIEQQPAHDRRSVPTTTAIPRNGEQTPGNGLSKGQVLNRLEAMLHKSENGCSMAGENLRTAISKYESLNDISKSLMEEVQSFASA